MATRTPNGFLVFVGSLAAVFLVAVIFVWTIASGPRPGDLDTKRAEGRLAARAKLDKEEAEALTTEAWVDKAKGIVRVPVNNVLAATAKELAGKKAAPSQVKVEAPIPPPVVDPNSTEPPPPAMPSAPQGADMIHFATLSTPAPAAAPATAPAPAPAPAAAPAPAPAPATVPPAPAPTAPPPAPAPVPPPTTPPSPAPAVPPPAPVVPPPAAAPAPPPPPPPATDAPARPPLINPTEPK